ncbi:HIT family protein [Bacteroidia bacterium]|nr:HIT family protein [Bacteroidia bacterium]
MSTIFSKIVNGEIPCYKIAEDDKFFAFLDISPLAKGHTLVVPKQEVDYIFDLNDVDYATLLLFAKKIAKAMKQAITCNRIGVAVIGLDVPHAHVHLVPLNNAMDINFQKEHLSFSEAEMREIAAKISALVER